MESNKYTPCGGCGATEPDQRCIGCMHPFTEEEAKEQATGWRPLLEEVLSKHESGLLPDRFIYEKIKKFLYGE